MKKLLAVLLTTLLLTSLIPAASATEADATREYLPDGSYYVTVIEEEDSNPALRTTATKSKTRTYYSASDVAQWYVKVTGTFTYGNGTAKCTSSSVSTKVYAPNWSIASKSASKSGNKAIATATANHSRLGEVLTSMTQTVTLTCSATGQFS